MRPIRYPRNYKPAGHTLSVVAPLHNWRIILSTGWGGHLRRNVYASTLTDVFLVTRSVGLCGMVAPDGSDVWNPKQPGDIEQ